MILKMPLENLLKICPKLLHLNNLPQGATVGWVAGYITMKVGKAAATMIGGSLLVLQIAHHKGMFNVKLSFVSDKSFIGGFPQFNE